VHLQSVDALCKITAGVPRPGMLPSMCHLISTVAPSKKISASSPLLTKVMFHARRPRLRQHPWIPDLQTSRTCWIKTGALRVITTSACITSISITCTRVSCLANFWTRCSKTPRTIRASSCFYQSCGQSELCIPLSANAAKRQSRIAFPQASMQFKTHSRYNASC
jgi:hypothetical protein